MYVASVVHVPVFEREARVMYSSYSSMRSWFDFQVIFLRLKVSDTSDILVIWAI